MMRNFTFYQAAFSVLVNSFAQTTGKNFDYVIVGGGTSGLVVANRMSEDREGISISCLLQEDLSTNSRLSVTVLVIEAGPMSVPSSPSLL
jgi:ribulose 1,5-bisphosphate synthetase/thiazole synthase